MREAELFAAADKKRREAIDIRNNADQTVYQAEKTIADMGDKLDAGAKSGLEGQIAALKEALKGEDMEAIMAKTEAVQKTLYDTTAKMYQEAQAAAQAGQAGPGAPEGPAGDTVVDADYRDVDENN